MRQIGIALVAGLCAAAGPSSAETEVQTPAISMARIASSIQEAQPWGTITQGLLCVSYPTHLNWGSGIGKLNVRAFEAPARLELKNEGFSVKGDPTDPFADKEKADLAIGATITALHGQFCIAGNYFDRTAVKGEASMEVDWQLYSTIERRTVARSRTIGTAKFETSRQGGFEAILIAALNDSLSKFTATDDFKRLAATRPSTDALAPSAEAETAIVLPGSAAAQPMKISDAVGSVVLVLSGGGHGSGFLVSSDGYVFTAQHVVGSDKYVKVRWSDGLDGVGEVVRADRRRDVALIKVDPRGRQPLALRRTMPQAGDTVFAIGAPLDQTLQNTVTRGVASANRIVDGFGFIQSDVTINPGNSGGPLLNEQGQVLGIADLTLRERNEAPTGLNFFVPIDDALRFLSAEPK